LEISSRISRILVPGCYNLADFLDNRLDSGLPQHATRSENTDFDPEEATRVRVHFPPLGRLQEFDRMAKILAVWAIDIGQAALKAIKFVPGETPDQVVAEAFDFIEYPKILSQPDADPDELVREALATFTDRNDLKGCKVAISVPGQSGLVKFIKLPPVEKKRIPDIVKFEAKQQIPFALDEVVWAYQQIGGDAEVNEEEFTMAEVGLFAMKRDQINRAILPFAVAGIEVDVVQMSPIALYNYIAFDQLKGSTSKESVVLLDIGADNTDLIITDGSRIWQRNIPIGGNHFTRALTKELKLTFAKAEHLKRNATKAPDPRSIFTAMRGVFNDFASEINRSIGFYSSINRTAKIRKVIGMGNGFKLPGLQKFLQQNLSNEVTRLEGFDKIAGDEVKSAPQFQDNLASFAVAYGLGVQGLNRGSLSTNLLPPEIERVRLIRAKKPWALAASALIMLGLGLLFALGDFRVLAKVETTQFKEAVTQATSVSKKGLDLKTEFEKAKGLWDGKYGEGKALITDPSERALWPLFLKTVSAYFPDPVRDNGLDPDDPESQDELEKLRVHIDAIKPVWRTDLKTEWFDELDATYKKLMLPYDVANPPSGEGWVIQLVCHHYNPYPEKAQRDLPLRDPRRTDFGPYQFIIEKVLTALNDPHIRLFGVNHVALAWMARDPEWTSEKGSQNNNMASNTVPLLDRAAPSAGEGGGGGSVSMRGGGGASMMGGAGGGMERMKSLASAQVGAAKGGGYGDMMGRMQGNMMNRGAMGGGTNRMAGADAKKDVKFLTRTDFLLQFVWIPTKLGDQPPTKEELEAQLKAEADKVAEAEKNFQADTSTKLEEAIEADSLKKSQAIDSALSKAMRTEPSSGIPGVPGAAPSSGAPGFAPAPAGVPPIVPPGAPKGANPPSK
jgi:type IV pilus assembly protein PilM